MNKLLLITALTILTLAPVSCEKDQSTDECRILKDALLVLDSDAVGAEISKLADNLQPLPVNESDPVHLKNLETLIDGINSCNGLQAELLCYSCIYTLPPESEIVVMVDSAGTDVRRVLDIRTPQNDILSFAGIHK
jgi:hypothetical protein